jgi:hypothetical protein
LQPVTTTNPKPKSPAHPRDTGNSLPTYSCAQVSTLTRHKPARSRGEHWGKGYMRQSGRMPAETYVRGGA